MALFNRWENDLKSVISLNSVQKQALSEFNIDLNKPENFIEESNCPLCNSHSSTCIANKDRYGIELFTVICKSCGLLYSKKHLNEWATSAFYTKYYRSIYTSSLSAEDSFFQAQINHGEQIYRWLESHDIKLTAPLNVLEIGCGAGGILVPFKLAGHNTIGIDYGDTYLQYGRNQGLTLIHGGIENLLNLPKFDIVILSHVIEHFNNLSHELDLIKSICNHKGIIYIEVPGIRSIRQNYSGNFLLYLQNAHNYHFTKKTLCHLLSLHSLNPVHVTESIQALVINEPCKKAYTSDFIAIYSHLIRLEIFFKFGLTNGLFFTLKNAIPNGKFRTFMRYLYRRVCAL